MLFRPPIYIRYIFYYIVIYFDPVAASSARYSGPSWLKGRGVISYTTCDIAILLARGKEEV